MHASIRSGTSAVRSNDPAADHAAPGKATRTSQLAGNTAQSRVVQKQAADTGPANTAGTDSAAAGDEGGGEALPDSVDSGELILSWALDHEDAADGGDGEGEAGETAVSATAAAPVQLKTSAAAKAAKAAALRKKAQAATSTPIPAKAKIKRNLSSVVTIANKSGVQTVTIKPDIKDATLKPGAAKTRISMHFKLAGAKVKRGRITKVDTDYLSWTIQTRYSPKVTASSPSKYGRGTTKVDKGHTDKKRRTLGFHEGSHGTDHLAYLKAHALPVFAGKSGDKTKVYVKARAAYKKACNAYHAAMRAHTRAVTDCVGTKASFCKATP